MNANNILHIARMCNSLPPLGWRPGIPNHRVAIADPAENPVGEVPGPAVGRLAVEKIEQDAGTVAGAADQDQFILRRCKLTKGSQPAFNIMLGKGQQVTPFNNAGGLPLRRLPNIDKNHPVAAVHQL